MSGLLLAGDVGGTKTALAVYDPYRGPRAPLAEATLPSAAYPNLEALAKEFLRRTRLPVEKASFGVAGPVSSGRSVATNLPWEMDEERLEMVLDLRSVSLLNDLEAMAHAVPFLEDRHLYTLNRGEPDPGGAMAVISPGTGLGEAFITPEGSGYKAHPSEGGHTDFAPATVAEIGLLRYLLNRYGHASYERVCSGRGLPNVYEYLKACGHTPEPSWLTEKLAGASDPTPLIVQAALDRERPCGLCAAALDLFVSVLGARAGNLALTVLATGGVFLGGGIPPRILPALKKGSFMEAFRRKGRFSGLLSRVPVHVILEPGVLEPGVALLGAACHGLGESRKDKDKRSERKEPAA